MSRMDMKVNEQARASLLAAVVGLTDDEVNKKPTDVAWSINQVLEHLYLLETSVVKTLKQHIDSSEETAAKRRRIEAAANRDIKVDAPAYLVPNVDAAPLKEMIDKLATSHEALLEFVGEHNEAELTKKVLVHPVFGKMNLDQWITFVAYHEIRHTEQIQEVKQLLGIGNH